MRARADGLVASFREEGADLLSTLERSLARVKRLAVKRESPRSPESHTPFDAKIRRGDFDWNDVIGGRSNSPASRSAREWLAPRVELLHQAVFNVCNLGQPVEVAFSEMDSKVRRMRVHGNKKHGEG